MPKTPPDWTRTGALAVIVVRVNDSAPGMEPVVIDKAVLAYRPKLKSKAQKKRKRKETKLAKTGD